MLNNQPDRTLSRTIRLFVSSTFSDFRDERNYLQEKVFPSLRELCERNGARLQVIDLRWGVSEEAAHENKTISICLDEIARCQKISPRPNFIILLGDRYGWQPIPASIQAEEYKRIYRHISSHHPRVARVMDHWYQLDKNAVPEEYYLKPRSGKFGRLSEWNRVEELLRTHFRKAALELELYENELNPYFLSATAQEILNGALSVPEDVPDPRQHVFGFFRAIKGLPHDHTIERFRDFIDLNSEGMLDYEAQKLLSELKKKLTKKIPHNIRKYTANCTQNHISLFHIDPFCVDVERLLSHIITKQLKNLETITVLDAEIELHKTFKEERLKHFAGREELAGEINEYCSLSTLKESSSFILYGPGGTGKSSFMAMAVNLTEQLLPAACLIYRFIGTSPDSVSGKNLLNSITQEIAQAYKWKEYFVPATFSEQSELFNKALTFASAKKPLIIFLDALDQISDADNANNLAWLPAKLPMHCKLIASSLPGQGLHNLKSKMPASSFRKITPLSRNEGEEILEGWLSHIGRTLQDVQKEVVLAHFIAQGRPLYLKLAFEEVKHWRSGEKAILMPGINAMIRKLLKRLSKASNHGEMFVSRSLGYIAAAKNGLTEDEVMDLLSEDQEVLLDFRRRSPMSPVSDRLPVVIWSRLYFDIEPFLLERAVDGTKTLGFFHRQFEQVVSSLFLHAGIIEVLHQRLAEYFTRQKTYWDDAEELPNLRKLSELPYHLNHAGMINEMAANLQDKIYIKAKLQAGLSIDLFDEFYVTYSNLRQKDDNIILASKLPLSLFSFLADISSTCNLLMSLEDIHAGFVYRADKSFYLEFLKLGLSIQTRKDYCQDPIFYEEVEALFTIKEANMNRRDGFLAEAQKKYSRVMTILLKRKDLKKELARAYYEIAYVQYLRGNFDKSIENMENSALSAFEADDEIGGWISREVGGFIKSISCLNTNKHQSAFLEYQKICNDAQMVFLKYRSVNSTAERFVSNTLAHKIIIAFHLKDYREAKKNFELLKTDSWILRQQIGLKPLMNKSRLAMLRNRYDQAAKYLKEHLDSFIADEVELHRIEAFVEILYFYGLCLKKNGKEEEAQLIWQRGLSFPDEPGNHKWKEMIRT